MEEPNPLIALLWNEPTPPKRGPRPRFTLPMIATAGIELADREGLAAVTMEAVAQRLGLTKMALYRYLPGKAELVALMVEVGIGPPHAVIPATRSKSWQKALRTWARALFARFSEHPWALEATLGARVMGPNELDWLEHALAALTGTSLRGAEMLDVVVTILGHVRNLAQQLAAAPTQAEQAHGDVLRALVQGRAERFPALAAVLSERPPRAAQDAALDFGIERIVAGVEALIASRSSNLRR